MEREQELVARAAARVRIHGNGFSPYDLTMPEMGLVEVLSLVTSAESEAFAIMLKEGVRDERAAGPFDSLLESLDAKPQPREVILWVVDAIRRMNRLLVEAPADVFDGA